MTDLKSKILLRQLKNLNINPLELPPTEAWAQFLNKIDQTYESFEQDRYLMERSLEISSLEMQERWQELKTLEERWRKLGECVPDFIALINEEGLITFTNRAHNQLSYPMLEPVSYFSILPATLRENFVKTYPKLTPETKISLSFEDDTLENYQLKILPIDSSGKVFVLVLTNITELVKFEIEREARAKAEETVETKSRFLANMSHEIRTPLNGILGMVNLLADQTQDVETKNKLQIIKSCSDTLMSLINDILDFSKLEAGKFKVEEHDLEVFSCVKDLIVLLDQRAKENRVKLSFSIENEVPRWIKSDDTKIKQILLNLLGNAIKFTKEGSVHLNVKLVSAFKNHNVLQFSVTDTGLGISAENQDKLFKSFSQVDGNTTKKFGGTGLGLAITKGLIELLGGQIQVRSELGKGSTFFFEIPVLVSEVKAYQSDNFTVSYDRIREKGAQLKILIAEDNRVNQMVLLGYLKKLGLSADVAANGFEVLEFIKQHTYDIILMDCQMPEMDGFEATRLVKQKLGTKAPVIYAATASSLEEDKRKCSEAGMDGLISKPINVSELAQVFSDFLGKDKDAG